MSEDAEQVEGKTEEEEEKKEAPPPKRRVRKTREGSVGQQVAKAWANDESTDELIKIAEDARGEGREYARIVQRIIAEVEHEMGDVDELEHNPATVHGMDIGALFKFALTKGKMESDINELLTIIGRINRRAQRRRK